MADVIHKHVLLWLVLMLLFNFTLMKIQFIQKYIAIALLLSTATACKKQLDIIPQGSASKGNFWKTQQDAIKGANALYVNNDAEDMYGRGFFWFFNASDDMVTGRSNSQADNIKNFNKAYIGGGYTESQWSLRYANIKRANDILRNVPAIQMDEALKNRILGEAYFTAGLMYFQLTANYANDQIGVPIITVENMDQAAQVPQAKNSTENYAYVEKMLQSAANHLPYFKQLSSADYGRPHKAAAWAFLAKMYVYQKNYPKAILYTDSVIQFGDRALLPSFADVFKAANNYASEYIYSIACSPNVNGVGFGSKLPGVILSNKAWGKYNGWGYYLPTKELYDSFEQGDKRRSVTLLAPGDSFKFFGETRTFQPVSGALSDYQFSKYMEPFSYENPIPTHVNANGDNGTTDLNVPLMRYAEVLLLKAEAKIISAGAGAGDTELNLIRTRAGLTPKQGMTLSDLKRERRNELAGEWADRHRDLVRWGDATQTYAQPLHNSKGAVIWQPRAFTMNKSAWAVPQREIDNSNGVIKQNPAWQ